MAHDFGDIDKFQFQKLLKQRMIRALNRAYEWALHNNEFHLATMIIKFRESINPIATPDDSILPAGNLRHCKNTTRAKIDVKVACYQVAMRDCIAQWWEYILKEDPTADDDKAMNVTVGSFEKIVKDYPKLKVRGTMKDGFYLELPNDKI